MEEGRAPNRNKTMTNLFLSRMEDDDEEGLIMAVRSRSNTLGR